jgi:peptidoglycan/LPS O-acetylase OafA/YrhL
VTLTNRTAGYRPYLDGLRAVAVGGVIVYHLDRLWLPGGFLGVDLFFVLSGYLITTLLVGEHRRTGRLDLPAFWSRRVRRLLPALLVLLLVISVVTLIGGDELTAASARGDMLATLFYVANWRFILTDQSYFNQFMAPSPVRHAWSLAIEEQFYLFWPLVTSLVLARLGSRALAAVALVASVASIGAMWLLFDASADPSRAYYGTDARIYELLIGALLAMALASSGRDRLLAAARPLAVPCLVVVLAAMWLLPDNISLYYHGGGPAFVLVGAVLIAGLEGGSQLTRLLALKPIVLIGLISYGLYLWHWPVTLFVGQQMGPTSAPLAAATVVLATLALAAISYAVVERPIRRGGRIGSLRLNPRRLLVVVPASSAVVALAIVLATSTRAIPAWAGQGGSPIAVEVQPGGGSESGPGLILGVVGDSVMVSAEPGLRSEARSRGWTLVEAAFAGCPVGYLPLFDALGVPSPFNERCTAVQAAHDTLLAAHPDLIVWHDLQSVLSRRAVDGQLLVAGSSGWTQDLLAEWEKVLDRLTASGARVAIVLPPLRSQDVAGCAGSVRPDRCAEVQAQDSIIRTATELFWSHIKDRGDVQLVRIDQVLCPSGYPCPATIDGIDVRESEWDQTHFTEAGAEWIAPRLLDLSLTATGIGGP